MFTLGSGNGGGGNSGDNYDDNNDGGSGSGDDDDYDHDDVDYDDDDYDGVHDYNVDFIDNNNINFRNFKQPFFSYHRGLQLHTQTKIQQHKLFKLKFKRKYNSFNNKRKFTTTNGKLN